MLKYTVTEVIRLFDNYIHSLTDGGTFIAGYNICNITTNENPVFLFTTLRILRVVSGSAEWRVGDRVLNISEGDVAFVNNVEPRKFIRIFGGALRCEIFALSPVLLAKESSLFRLFYGGIDDSVIRTFDPLSYEIRSILDVILGQMSSANENSILSVTHLFLSVASLMLTSASLSGKSTRSTAVIEDVALTVSKAMSYISNHLSEDLSINTLSQMFGLSREYFTISFKRHTGTSPATYIKRARLDRAIYLLKTEKINVLDAALESGFGSSSGFYKAFSSVCGMSPKEFIDN